MQNIFLIGMPSSGKSTLGKGLAKALGYEFYEMDTVIETTEQMSIAQMFEKYGEEYFRQKEQETLQNIPANNRLVVSTGGGTPCFFDNMAYIKANGMSIYLDIKPEILFARMNQSRKSDRPHYPKDDPEMFNNLSLRYHHRQQYYRQANIIIEGDTDVATLLATVNLQGVGINK